jgi:hypothetical protein
MTPRAGLPLLPEHPASGNHRNAASFPIKTTSSQLSPGGPHTKSSCRLISFYSERPYEMSKSFPFYHCSDCYTVGIYSKYYSALGYKSPALSRARPEPDPKFGLGPGLGFFEAQALGSQAKPGPNITRTLADAIHTRHVVCLASDMTRLPKVAPAPLNHAGICHPEGR